MSSPPAAASLLAHRGSQTPCPTGFQTGKPEGQGVGMKRQLGGMTLLGVLSNRVASFLGQLSDRHRRLAPWGSTCSPVKRA